MKTLTVSIKSSSDFLVGFAKDFKTVSHRKAKGSHYEISFDNQKDFDRFVKNVGILSQILMFKPKSVYELAKRSKMDLSNLNKIILFFEEIGAIRIKKTKVNGRTVKTPIVEYGRIEFPLKAA